METELIRLQADTSGQDFRLRVLRFQGSGNAASVYIQAALHAHEMPGMVAIDRLIPRLIEAENSGRLAGNVTVLPHANPVGLAQGLNGETLGRFDLNSRVNFNRSFPTKPAKELSGKPASERLKATLIDIAIQSDVVLDLHCDDEGPLYLYVSEHQLGEGHRLARALQASVILTDTSTDPISFDLAVGNRWAAESRSDDARFAATVEFRGMLDVTPALAEQDAEGLYRYLAAIGTIVDELPDLFTEDPIVGHVDAAELIPSPAPGALLYDVDVGDWVKKGQRLAVVLSEPGAHHEEIQSPFDGFVMTRRNQRLIRRGDDVIKVLCHP